MFKIKMSELCPEIKKNWKEYFDKEELNQNIKLIENGLDPNDKE
jgi:hypothetical protein